MSEFILWSIPVKPSIGIIKHICATSNFWASFRFKIQLSLPELSSGLDFF